MIKSPLPSAPFDPLGSLTMPDPTPEQDQNPPQWPPPSWHTEPTTKPQRPGHETTTKGSSASDSGSTETQSADSGVSFSVEPTGRSLPESTTTSQEPAAKAAADDSDTAPPPRTIPAGPPPTHGRGVRMAIYGTGGAIVIGLLVAIVVISGGTIVPNLGGNASGSEDDSKLIADGEVDEERYRSLAEAVGTEEWVDWRHGPAASEKSDAEEITQPKTSTTKLTDSIEYNYQYGDDSFKTPRSNLQGQLGLTGGDSAKAGGVHHVTTAESTPSSVGFSPRPGGSYSQDAVEVELLSGSTAECIGDTELGQLVDMDRSAAEHTGGIAAHAVMAFSSGVIATAGTSTAQGGTCTKLPASYVPTAVSVTPGNEFALVTVWDTDKVRGRVAVIALGGTPGQYPSSWPKVYPGLPNPGHFSFAKPLGYIDLDAKAPTSVASGTDFAAKSVTREESSLDTPLARTTHENALASTGFVAVASKEEKLVEWIDLTPLLTGMKDTYFKGDPSVFADTGLDEKQWPPTFDSQKEFAPTMSKSMSLDAEPTALSVVEQGLFVADSEEGLTRYDSRDPSQPKAADPITLPGAATDLEVADAGESLLAVSRGHQSVSWVSVADAEISQTLRDARLRDPVSVEAESLPIVNSEASLSTIVVADYMGKALHSYRYGKLEPSFADDASLDAGSFEYGGSYEPGEKVFGVETTIDIL